MFTQIPSRRHSGLPLPRRAAGLLAGVLLFAIVAPPLAASVTVPEGTKVSLEFTQKLDSRHASKGDRVSLRAQEDVIVNGEKVIARGAPATATVMEVVKPKSFGKKASIKLNNLRVRGMDGNQIQLSQYTSGKRYADAKAVGAGAGGLIVLGPIGLAAGAFFKGGHLEIKPGTTIAAAVQHNITVSAAR